MLLKLKCYVMFQMTKVWYLYLYLFNDKTRVGKAEITVHPCKKKKKLCITVDNTVHDCKILWYDGQVLYYTVTVAVVGLAFLPSVFYYTFTAKSWTVNQIIIIIIIFTLWGSSSVILRSCVWVVRVCGWMTLQSELLSYKRKILATPSDWSDFRIRQCYQLPVNPQSKENCVYNKSVEDSRPVNKIRTG